MPRGNAPQSKVLYNGKDEDFVVFVDDTTTVDEWKKDRSIPLAEVVSSFKIFVANKHAQGTYDGASNATLDNEFDTHVDEDVIKQILEKGSVQEADVDLPSSDLPKLAVTDKGSRYLNARVQRTPTKMVWSHTESSRDVSIVATMGAVVAVTGYEET